MDGADEQSSQQRRGDRLAGDRVQLTAETPPVQLNIFGDPEPEPSADAPGSFVISQAEIDAELRSGSGFAGSRGRIYAFYQNYVTKGDAIAFLKKEYGIGGHSHTFLDGSRGFVEYEPSKGMTIRHYPTNTEFRIRWTAIEERIRLMVRENTYLSPEEVLEWEKNHLEELPDDLEESEELEPEVIDSVEEPENITIIPAVNFHITDDTLGCGSVRQKFQANLAAIRLLKELEAENRNATPADQEVLSKYVGWGGMPQVFDPENHAWETEYAQIKEALEDFEYTDARSSVLNAHYTSPMVIKAIYEAVGNLGFTSGNILEPACGVGNFFGLLPEEMSASRLYGVELDSISGRIAKKLYPEADITVAGFETTDRRNFYDLAIGNVPFGQYQVNDKAYNGLGFTIHNYFFAKAIDQVRPGGIVAFVTSRYTMDAQGQEVRKYIAERAELLGAIRLPNNAFLANAGTQVCLLYTSDAADEL